MRHTLQRQLVVAPILGRPWERMQLSSGCRKIHVTFPRDEVQAVEPASGVWKVWSKGTTLSPPLGLLFSKRDFK